MREERLYLQDIRESIDKIVSYTRDLSFDAFENDQKSIDAVLRNFEIIGEASKNLSKNTKEMDSDIPWSAIISTRNALVHEYFGADLVEVWKTIKDDLPVLREGVEKISRSF